MSGKALRLFALLLLDDEHGINGESWDILRDFLYDDDQNDILDAVKAQDGRFYLPDEAMPALRKGI